ncbi:MAG TPA: hypothetical protein VIT67_12290 [Povalibacter sp.]
MVCYRMLGLAALVTLLQACGDPKSSSTSGPDGGPVPTSRMTIALRVESVDLSTAEVRANLNDGRTLGKSYRLDGGDFFRACVNGVCRSMADNDSLTSPDYIARFDFQPGVDYVVAFNRQEAENAPDSRVVLPPAFTIVTPANHQQVTDGETVVVSWAPTGAPALASLSYHAECTFLSGAHGVSSGMLSTDANADGRELVDIDPIVDFVASNSLSTITRCSIDVTVSHELLGRIDPAFHNGTAVGIVSREVNLDYIPR